MQNQRSNGDLIQLLLPTKGLGVEAIWYVLGWKSVVRYITPRDFRFCSEDYLKKWAMEPAYVVSYNRKEELQKIGTSRMLNHLMKYIVLMLEYKLWLLCHGRDSSRAAKGILKHFFSSIVCLLTLPVIYVQFPQSGFL